MGNPSFFCSVLYTYVIYIIQYKLIYCIVLLFLAPRTLLFFFYVLLPFPFCVKSKIYSKKHHFLLKQFKEFPREFSSSSPSLGKKVGAKLSHPTKKRNNNQHLSNNLATWFMKIRLDALYLIQTVTFTGSQSCSDIFKVLEYSIV